MDSTMQNSQNDKITDFVTHLLSNPNLKNEPILLAEGIVLNFIATNLEKLKITFKSPQFFPELSTREVLSLIINDLKKRVINDVLPTLFSYIDEIDFTVLRNFEKSDSYNGDYYRKLIKKFLSEILQNKDVRYTFNAALNIFKQKAFERYLSSSFGRRSPLYFELVRVQKNNLKTEEYINYLKIILLFKGAAYAKADIPGFTEKQVCMNDFIKDPKSLEEYFSKRSKDLSRTLPGVSPILIEMALKSNVAESLTQPEDSSAHLIYILTQRYQNFQEYQKIERGAETPDKSWFGIMRKNAGYYGFDKRLLEDLYMIAGDNNW